MCLVLGYLCNGNKHENCILFDGKIYIHSAIKGHSMLGFAWGTDPAAMQHSQKISPTTSILPILKMNKTQVYNS